MSKPHFIVVEGIDGSGKTTVAAKIEHFLSMQGKEVRLTNEPTKSHYGVALRRRLREDSEPFAHAQEYLDLYLRDRREHVKKFIQPHLVAGRWIVSDRYKYSTIVYQAAQGASAEKIIQLHRDLPVPSLVVVLDVPAETALARVKADAKRSHLEKFERLDFQQKIREGFKDLPKLLPRENIVVVDASQGLDKVFEQIRPALEKLAG